MSPNLRLSIYRPFRFIPKGEIEAKAVDILLEMGKNPHYSPKWPLDTSRVAEFLGLDVVWDKIPDDEQGQIAAKILPLERLIEINEDIPHLRGRFGESTLAHEVGHWVLHINPAAVEQGRKWQQRGKILEVEPLLCRSEGDLKGIEWQAQYFASCLLMPQEQLKKATLGRDLTRWTDLYQIAQELGVTISNLIHRLKDVGWISLADHSRTIQRL